MMERRNKEQVWQLYHHIDTRIYLLGIALLLIAVISSFFGIKQKALKKEIQSVLTSINGLDTTDYSNFLAASAQQSVIELLSFDRLSQTEEELRQYTQTAQRLKNTERQILNPYPITTPSNSLSAAFLSPGSYIGTIKCNRWGLNLSIYYSGPFDNYSASLAQAHVDASNKGDVFGQPFGVKGGSYVGDHNTQTGYLWGKAKPGDKIYITTPYGQFLYQVTHISYGDYIDNQIYDRTTGINMYGSGYDLVMYTCYPFNMIETDQRWLVYANLIDGTILS